MKWVSSWPRGWMGKGCERGVINHFPFTSRERPRAVFGSAFPCAFPLLFLGARTGRACKTAPALGHWLSKCFSIGSRAVGGAGRPHSGWRASGPADWWRQIAATQICGHGGPPPRMRPATPNEARHPETKAGRLAENGSPHPCTPMVRHWLSLWNVRSSFAGAPCARPK